MKYEIGHLKYGSTTDVGTLSKKLVIGLSIGAMVLILILVVCLIMYCQKSNQNLRILKSMPEKMDIVELQVAAECKEGKKFVLNVIRITAAHPDRKFYFDDIFCDLILRNVEFTSHCITAAVHILLCYGEINKFRDS